MEVVFLGDICGRLYVCVLHPGNCSCDRRADHNHLIVLASLWDHTTGAMVQYPTQSDYSDTERDSHSLPYFINAER